MLVAAENPSRQAGPMSAQDHQRLQRSTLRGTGDPFGSSSVIDAHAVHALLNLTQEDSYPNATPSNALESGAGNSGTVDETTGVDGNCRKRRRVSPPTQTTTLPDVLPPPSSAPKPHPEISTYRPSFRVKDGVYRNRSAIVLGRVNDGVLCALDGDEQYVTLPMASVSGADMVSPLPPSPIVDWSLGGNEGLRMSVSGLSFLMPCSPVPETECDVESVEPIEADPGDAKPTAPVPVENSRAASSTVRNNDTRALDVHDRVDDLVGTSVQLRRGKYAGRTARVVGRTPRKVRCVVEGVPYQLEYYPSNLQPL
jgi:hypothetical protein